MRFRLLLALALSMGSVAVSAQPAPTAPAAAERAERWWADVVALSDDSMEGRGTGRPGHARAVEFVVQRLQALGLEPAGTDGFLQPIVMHTQRIDPATSRGSIVRRGGAARLAIPGDILPLGGSVPAPARLDADMVFVGYGLHAPEEGHDDLAGLDLRGRVALFVDGIPAGLSQEAAGRAAEARQRLLIERGAVGAIAIVVGALPTPWDQLAPRALARPSVFARAPGTPEPRPFLTALLNPEAGDLLFAGAPTQFGELRQAAATRQALPRFALPSRLQLELGASVETLNTMNVVARLPGADPALRSEHVVLTAHLDHLGVGEAVDGDAIYNGALDNAAGSAALLDIAGQLRRTRGRRSILFAWVTGEELGLRGARYFVANPTVPRASIVANLNYDMALPLFPLRSVTVIGADQSSLGASAEAVGQAMGLPLAPDPFPERNSFVRSDHYAFIESGIPAVAFKFGFAAGTPEAATEGAWRQRIYHSPQDGPGQPGIFRDDEIRLHDFIGSLALRVANDDARPRWNEDSPYRPR
jgi:hypothetical protein